MKRFLYFIIVVALIAFVGNGIYKMAIAYKSSGSIFPNSERVTQSDVFDVALQIIKDKVPNASTAKFSDIATDYRQDGDNTYTVKSFVDTKSSFGNEVRKYWVVRLKYNGGPTNNLNSYDVLEADFNE